MMNNDRGRGGTGPKKESKIIPRYSISPQLAPPRMTATDKSCLNSPAVSAPQKPGARMK